MPEISPEVLSANLSFADFPEALPDPQVADHEFELKIERIWQVCDRFDLQTDIWRGRLLRLVRDRQKQDQEIGFLDWLKDHEISKSQAYGWISLADSADVLLQDGLLDQAAVERFSKRAFIATAQTEPQVQQLVSEAARQGEQITCREVRELSDQWLAVSSDLVPGEIKQMAAANQIPSRYVAPFVREIAKIPPAQRSFFQEAVAHSPDLDTLKTVTAEAQKLARYLSGSDQVQAIATAVSHGDLDLDQALEESLRLGCLKSTADLVNYAAQIEQTTAKLFTIWKRLNALAEQVFVASGASTPQLRSLLTHLEPLLGDQISFNLTTSQQAIRVEVQIREQLDL
ncbi:MAG: hypothetical protein SFT94_11915 [Pseudanabaenaceae cyanobacterium bins.68]|nr:hypothetical protein [Pseudanabaenaceae cyanobacterium bins.68]